MSRRSRIQYALEFASGLAALLFANIVCYITFTAVIPKILEYPQSSWCNYVMTLFVVYTIVFVFFSSPLNLLMRSRPREFLSTLRNCVVTYALLAVVLLLTKNEIIDSRYLFISSFIVFFVVDLMLRYITKKSMLKKITNSRHATQTGIITIYSKADKYITDLQLDWTKNIKAVALLDAEYENNGYYCITSYEESAPIKTRTDEIYNVPVVANKENLMGWIRTAALDEVYINLPAGNESYITILIEELEDMGITVHVNIPILEKILQNSKFDNINCSMVAGHPVAIFAPAVHNDREIILKKTTDFIGGLLGTVLSLPIILITAIPLLIESPGPLIFKQARVGKNGRIFNIYKLRSMYADAEKRKQALMAQNKMDGHMFKMDNDPRITKVGKFIRKYSIDELPQFWNVLKGDMSLIGTRPPTVEEFEQYESHHKRRLSMKPGITGLWQVSGRSNIQDFEEVVKLDCEYIDTWSPALDIKILFKTVNVVLTHKGAE
ncbi:MAG: sugar transferase [Eubacterium sp.]|nr:sugar transferase [Eubacterium sp.]